MNDMITRGLKVFDHEHGSASYDAALNAFYEACEQQVDQATWDAFTDYALKATDAEAVAYLINAMFNDSFARSLAVAMQDCHDSEAIKEHHEMAWQELYAAFSNTAAFLHEGIRRHREKFFLLLGINWKKPFVPLNQRELPDVSIEVNDDNIEVAEEQAG